LPLFFVDYPPLSPVLLLCHDPRTRAQSNFRSQFRVPFILHPHDEHRAHLPPRRGNRFHLEPLCPHIFLLAATPPPAPHPQLPCIVFRHFGPPPLSLSLLVLALFMKTNGPMPVFPLFPPCPEIFFLSPVLNLSLVMRFYLFPTKTPPARGRSPPSA